jgi:hypothetical protein
MRVAETALKPPNPGWIWWCFGVFLGSFPGYSFGQFPLFCLSSQVRCVKFTLFGEISPNFRPGLRPALPVSGELTPLKLFVTFIQLQYA